MSLIIRLLISTLAVLVASNLVPGVHVDGTITAVIVALVLAFLNTFIRPVVQILALPLTILTLGLFYFVVNVLMILLAAYLVDGFSIDGFIAALFFGIIMTVVSTVLGMFLD
ncbi:phage holin family protein [Dyadobacter tibetensis]|uniref:phage holin family protein n=1 Tax=Dyadobacter tibetensis TaxID=1211851 RepID=UPI000472C6F5|nr:phage holin family protein [Dyadobacter tibetensis]